MKKISINNGKATQIKLWSFKPPHMRTFHLTWLAFFLCFFGWFGITPMLKIIRDDLGITTDQIVTANIVAVASTILMRLIIGWLCDKIGPRIAYAWLLILGSLPVMLIGLSQNYEQFLFFRMLIGAIGASFVITQFHTSMMFAPNIVGTANATTAGWGNLGGGVTQQVMPLVFAGALTIFGAESLAWRYAMVVPGILLFTMGFIYLKFTRDAPSGNYKELKKESPSSKARTGARFSDVVMDYRVWMLFIMYGACFGVELIVNSQAALYFADYFEMNLTTAGAIAGIFGLMNVFARSLGGFIGDRFGMVFGLSGRVRWLFMALFIEGITLIIFSRMGSIPAIIASLVVLSLFVQMSEGATYGVVPFINKKAMGAVAGIVGAGGNTGAVVGMLLFKKQLTGLEWTDSFLVLGVIVCSLAFLSFLVKFSTQTEKEVKMEMSESIENTEPAAATV